MKPLIGITGKRAIDTNRPEVNESFRQYDRFLCSYARAISKAGATPVLLPLEANGAELVAHLDGVIFSGGADIDPKHYSQDPDPNLGEVQQERDSFELELLEAVLTTSTPALGICRGMQLFNIAAGGTLHQHIEGHRAMVAPPADRSHTVNFDSGTVLGSLYGTSHQVNSLHHQSVDRLGSGWIISGRLPSGSVEAIEHQTLPLLAVQWHPELLPQRSSDPLFSWLVARAAATRA